MYVLACDRDYLHDCYRRCTYISIFSFSFIKRSFRFLYSNGTTISNEIVCGFSIAGSPVMSAHFRTYAFVLRVPSACKYDG